MINIHNITKNINGESLIVSSSFSINYNEKIALTADLMDQENQLYSKS